MNDLGGLRHSKISRKALIPALFFFSIVYKHSRSTWGCKNDLFRGEFFKYLKISTLNIMEKIIVWFRNDLRLHDHEALWKASQRQAEVICVYVYDPRCFRELPIGFKKTGALRAQFLVESVANLRENLQRLGSDLVIRTGRPEDILPDLAEQWGVSSIYTSEEATYEETQVDIAMQNRLRNLGIEMNFFWMTTLFHLDELPFEINKLPDVFTEFRKRCEKFCKIRPIFPVPTSLRPLPEDCHPGKNPTLSDLGYSEKPTSDSRGVMHFGGGESAALAHLNQYFWKKDLLKTYKETRNEMLGPDFSSKFSPWLALGCLSPRYIYEEVKRYETERVSNESTYWLIFELIWRDYFRFVAMKFGNKLFFLEGIKYDLQLTWKSHQPTFEKWRTGQTGIPLVDANMQELLKTGFMSNRGRQNVASFLAKDLKINWTWGAAWFESQLLDYDVCSNWGNWNYVAGVGNDPRENRYFNMYSQATRYDQEGRYVKHWLPQLRHIPAPKVHIPSTLASQELAQFGVRLGVDYPMPLVNPSKWL
jgi:deoxyribodipyrimidine photo-lyase